MNLSRSLLLHATLHDGGNQAPRERALRVYRSIGQPAPTLREERCRHGAAAILSGWAVGRSGTTFRIIDHCRHRQTREQVGVTSVRRARGGLVFKWPFLPFSRAVRHLASSMSIHHWPTMGLVSRAGPNSAKESSFRPRLLLVCSVLGPIIVSPLGVAPLLEQGHVHGREVNI